MQQTTEMTMTTLLYFRCKVRGGYLQSISYRYHDPTSCRTFVMSAYLHVVNAIISLSIKML